MPQNDRIYGHLAICGSFTVRQLTDKVNAFPKANITA